MLKNLNIDEVKEGMFVDSIVKQQGKFKITSRGRITSRDAIEQLRKKGILSVVIDTSKQLDPKAAEQEDELESHPEPPKISFESEIKVASKLYSEGKNLQKIMLEAVAKDLPVDMSIPAVFTNSLITSIERNPSALMCMTRIGEKDTYLFEHSLNVAILLANFGTHVGLNEEQIQELTLSGFLHDIGKTKIPDEILNKPGRLTDQEMTIMRDHVYYGTKVLIEMGIPDSIVKTIGEHHERLDGYGYPEGLRGNEISKFGLMIAIADTYDAITSDSCYKAEMSSKKALQILLRNSPEKYDEVLVNQFVQCVGIFPVGSLVKLNNEKIAMVLKLHPVHATKPVVKVFYSVRGTHYLESKELDLAIATNGVKIVDAVVASDFKLNFNKYFKQSIAL